MNIPNATRPVDDNALEDALIAAWHDVEFHGGEPYPVLWYDLERAHWALPMGGDAPIITEPCLYCGRRHHHGDLEGSRVPHCGDHTHELTRTGRHRSPYARGATVCRAWHRDYIIRRRPASAWAPVASA